MGVMKFRLPPPELAIRLPDFRKAFMTGLDRTPGRMVAELRPPDLLICRREFPESGRLHVPWFVEGFGSPMVGTATLAERDEPFDMVIELARGKLNEVRNQAADWRQLGLQTPAEFEQDVHESQQAFAHAATSRADLVSATRAAQQSLLVSHRGADRLMASYTQQVLESRIGAASKLSTWLACALNGKPKQERWTGPLGDCLNAARIGCTWAQLAPEQGHYHWDILDAQLAWCRKRKLTPLGGPIVEFHASALPDWIWLWQGDFEAILGLVVDLVKQTINRYRGKISVWTVAHRPATTDVLGLSEEEQVRLTAKALQVARLADPRAQLVVGLDQPWAEWMGTSTYQFGPLHLADELARAELGMGGVGLEIAPGFGPPGSQLRDLLEFSKLLDLYALLNMPLHLSMVFPSGSTPDSKADELAQVEADQWPRPPDEELQADWAQRWTALAVAKPFVRSVTWLQATDAERHLFAHGGLFRPDLAPKLIVERLKAFRQQYLE
jgi:hypothetical protein